MLRETELALLITIRLAPELLIKIVPGGRTVEDVHARRRGIGARGFHLPPFSIIAVFHSS
jgi:hypothetical protein